VYNEQTSSNMCKNFRLKHFHISRDKKQNSVTHHKANYASGSSFTLPLVRRLHQTIIRQLVSRNVLNGSFIFLCHSCWTLFPLLCGFWMSDVDIMPFVSDNIPKIFEDRILFTPFFTDKFLQDIPN